jgi:hypothetical protein
MPRLTGLNVRHSNVTDGGVSKFKEYKPKCTVTYGTDAMKKQ